MRAKAGRERGRAGEGEWESEGKCEREREQEFEGKEERKRVGDANDVGKSEFEFEVRGGDEKKGGDEN